MKTQRLILIGPHHGEYDFHELFDSPYRDDTQFKDIGYIDNEGDMGPGDEYIKKEDLELLFPTHETLIDKEDINWGWYTQLRLDLRPDRLELRPEGHPSPAYKMMMFIDKIVRNYLTAFINCSGDDDTFDYMPSFIDCLEQILTLLGKEHLIRKSRFSCYITTFDIDHARELEFFTDEEIEEFENYRRLLIK